MSSSEYLDCELHLTGYDRAELSVAGKNYSGQPALDDALQRRLLEVHLDSKQYGTLLFESLFTGDDNDLHAGYRESLAIARHEEKRLRFRLRIASDSPSSLHGFHWELLYDPKEKLALSRSRETAFSRYLEGTMQPGKPLAGTPRLLVVISAPKNLTKYDLYPIDAEQTRRSIASALQPLADHVTCEFLQGPATPSRICERLEAGRFHVLHLLAHGLITKGNSIAHLVLECEEGLADFVEESRFSEIFGGDRNLRLVTLIACAGGVQPRADPFSGLGPAVVERGIPAVVAMRNPIGVEAAALFTEHFYRSLAGSGRVDTAANQARMGMYLDKPGRLEWYTPALFMRLPEGLLWKLSESPQVIVDNGESKSLESDSGFPWSTVIECIRDDNIVPILGPGMHRGLLPTSKNIAARWAKEFRYPVKGEASLPRVAQYVQTRRRGYPYRKLPKILAEELLEREEVKQRDRLRSFKLSEVIAEIAVRHFDRDEDEPHRILADLDISNYMTTCYDSFMTAALTFTNKNPVRRSCAWKGDLPKEYGDLDGTKDRPLVFHLYGNDEDKSSLVLTEDDYLDFLGAIAKDFDYRIPTSLAAEISDSMLLFLGFDVSTLECHVLFRGLVHQLEHSNEERVAILQFENEEKRKNAELVTFMKRYCRDMRIKVYDGTVRNFLIALRDQLRAEHAGH